MYEISFLLSLLFLINNNVTAEDENSIDIFSMSFNELLNVKVITVSKREQLLSQTPGIVTVITAEQIANFGFQGLHELMSIVPGFSVSDTYWKRAIVTGRGIAMTLYNDKMLMLVNGIPLYDSSTMEYYLDSVPISAIKRIEVVRGPGSVLYGTNAFSAVINIITYSADEIEKNRFKLQIGSFSNKQSSLFYNHQTNNVSFMVAANISDNDGYKKTAIDETGVSGEIEYEADKDQIYTQLKFGEFSFAAGYYRHRWSKFGVTPNFNFGNRGDVSQGRADRKRHYFQAIYEHRFEQDMGLKITVHYDDVERWIDIGSFADVLFAVGATDIESEDTFAHFTGTTLWSEIQFDTRLSDQAAIISGLTYEQRDVGSIGAAHSAIGGLLLNQNSSRPLPIQSIDYAAYFQLDGNITQALSYNVGIRSSHQGINDKTAFTPRGGLVYNLSQGSNLKLLYGEAFRSPSTQEQYFQVPFVIYGRDAVNESLASEQIESWELAWDKKLYDKNNLRLNLYQTKVKEVINRRVLTESEAAIIGSQNGLIYDNLGSQSFSGIEIEFKAFPNESFNYFINASFKHTDDDSTQKELSFIEDYTFNAGFLLSLNGSDLSMLYQYVDNREGTLADGSNSHVDGFGLLHLVARKSLNKNLQLKLTVNNLLDEDYLYPESVRRNIASIPGGPGRAIYVALIYQF